MAARSSKPSAAQGERTDPKATLPLHPGGKLIGRTVLAALLVALAAWVAWDFLPALAWAIVLALTTWPLYARFAALFGDRRSGSIPPLLFTLFVGIILLMPLRF